MPFTFRTIYQKTFLIFLIALLLKETKNGRFDISQKEIFKIEKFVFQTWLDELNNINGWHQTRSPVIWKEISRMGAKKYLIGGLSEFWEYCYDYYGFQSRMSREDINKIMKDNALIVIFLINNNNLRHF